MQLQSLRLWQDLVQDVVRTAKEMVRKSRVAEHAENALQPRCIDDRFRQHGRPNALAAGAVIRKRLNDPPVLASIAALASPARLGSVYPYDARAAHELARLAVDDLCERSSQIN